jgi:hypothetical protein
VTTNAYGGYNWSAYSSFSMYGGGGDVHKKTDIMKRELNHIASLLLGMVVVNDYKRGQRLVEKSIDENAEFFRVRLTTACARAR